MFKIRIFMHEHEQLFLLFDGSENQFYDIVKMLYYMGVSENIHNKNFIFKNVQKPYWGFEQPIQLFLLKNTKSQAKQTIINVTQISLFLHVWFCKHKLFLMSRKWHKKMLILELIFQNVNTIFTVPLRVKRDFNLSSHRLT